MHGIGLQSLRKGDVAWAFVWFALGVTAALLIVAIRTQPASTPRTRYVNDQLVHSREVMRIEGDAPKPQASQTLVSGPEAELGPKLVRPN